MIMKELISTIISESIIQLYSMIKFEDTTENIKHNLRVKEEIARLQVMIELLRSKKMIEEKNLHIIWKLITDRLKGEGVELI